MKLTAKDAVIRVFNKSYMGEKLCNNDIVKKYPQFTYSSIKTATRELEINGYLNKQGDPGKVQYYWKAGDTAENIAYQRFITAPPPRLNENRRH